MKKTGTFNDLTMWRDEFDDHVVFPADEGQERGIYFRPIPGMLITMAVESRTSADPFVEVVLQCFSFDGDDEVFAMDSCDGEYYFSSEDLIDFRFYRPLTNIK